MTAKMNKRQAKFIMELPDGYEWTFLRDVFLLGAHPEKEVLLYEIVGDELVNRKINVKDVLNGN